MSLEDNRIKLKSKIRNIAKWYYDEEDVKQALQKLKNTINAPILGTRNEIVIIRTYCDSLLDEIRKIFGSHLCDSQNYNPKKISQLCARDSQHRTVEGNGSRVSSAGQSTPKQDVKVDDRGERPSFNKLVGVIDNLNNQRVAEIYGGEE